MSIKRILEVLFNSNGSSGYSFPFSLKPLNFYYVCKEAENKIQNLYLRVHESSSKEIIDEIMGLIKKVTDNENIKDLANKLSDINRLFQKLRFSFNIPEKGKLSDKLSEDSQAQNNCKILIGEMEVYIHENIADHIFQAIKLIIGRCKERENMLFANNNDQTVPRTNNGIEQFFRKIRRNVRKRYGNMATGKVLSEKGTLMALYQNMGNQKYIATVFGTESITAYFNKYRNQLRKKGISKKKIVELVERGMEMLLNDTISDTPYTEEVMNMAYLSIKNNKNIG